MDNEYLTSVETLAELVQNGNVALIDTREASKYAAGHIKGAVNIYEIFSYLATEANGGYEAMRKFFTERFGASGLCGQERVVVYEDAMHTGYARSCRGWFILRYLGHRNVTVLHGGYQAWRAKGYPETVAIPEIKPKQFPVSLDPFMILTTEEMLDALDKPGIIKLDCRDRSEWTGVDSSPYSRDFAPRKGRLPGAVWIEWYNTMYNRNGICWFKEPDELRALFDAAGIHADSTVYLYCFKGARTSNVFIAMKMAGIHNVRSYFASWNEWSRHPELPIISSSPE
jgi:thiosulfate/3-mercaptopyruvate sulfurtransferase